MKPTTLEQVREHIAHLREGKAECRSTYSSVECLEFLLNQNAYLEDAMARNRKYIDWGKIARENDIEMELTLETIANKFHERVT